MILRTLFLSCFTLFNIAACVAQPVTLCRLERATGGGFIPYTDPTGKQYYALLDTLVEASNFGSGTSGRIAVWSGDTLRSRMWEVTDTYIRGTVAGEPEVGTGIVGYTFRGDDDTGVGRTNANILGLFAGSVLPRAQVSASAFTVGYGSATWYVGSGYFGYLLTAGAPLVNVSGVNYTFQGDEDTGISRSTADILRIHAGDATNPVATFDGPGDAIRFDPNDDGVNDVTITATGTSIAGTLKVGTYFSSPVSDNIAGISDAGFNRITIGDGLTLTSDTLRAGLVATPYWSGGAMYPATTRFALTTTPDTVNFNNASGTPSDFTTGAFEIGITFDTVPGSNYRGWMFDEAGVYEFAYQFQGKGSDPATNKRAVFSWHRNGDPIDPFSQYGDRIHYIEGTPHLPESGSFIIPLTAGQYIQLVASVNTGSSNYDAKGFHVQIKKLRDL